MKDVTRDYEENREKDGEDIEEEEQRTERKLFGRIRPIPMRTRVLGAGIGYFCCFLALSCLLGGPVGQSVNVPRFATNTSLIEAIIGKWLAEPWLPLKEELSIVERITDPETLSHWRSVLVSAYLNDEFFNGPPEGDLDDYLMAIFKVEPNPQGNASESWEYVSRAKVLVLLVGHYLPPSYGHSKYPYHWVSNYEFDSEGNLLGSGGTTFGPWDVEGSDEAAQDQP